MSESPFEDEHQALAVQGRQRTLSIVLAINLGMFAGELIAGLLADSSALLADAADNLGDSVVYVISLVAIYRGAHGRVLAALTMGVLESVFGIAVLVNVGFKIAYGAEPVGTVILAVAVLALAGNLVSFALLTRHRGEDLNMRAVWLCTRNDALANLGIIAAGLLVILTGSMWPDVVIAGLVALVFLHTAGNVTLEAWRRMRTDT